MKKIALILILFSPLLSNAQFVKGDKYIGGRVTTDFLHHSLDNTNNTLFQIQPTIGILVSENTAITGNIGYRYSKSNQATFNSITNTFSIGMGARRFFSITENFLFSINGNIGFHREFGKTSYDAIGMGTTKNNNYTITTGISGSFLFFPSPKWAFEATFSSLTYTYSKNLSADKADSHRVGFHYLNTITLGISYFFQRSTSN